jgi:hypothetical protein
MGDRPMDSQARQLALEIARCPIIASVLRGDRSPCREVVNFQRRSAPDRWVAEPWSGHLEQAPILFLSSNPSAGDPVGPPTAGDLTASSDDEAILHVFDDAFEDGPWIGIHDGTHFRSANGRVGGYVAYWGSCKARASELLGRPAVVGVDYALTEVVHCSSQHEIGVRSAAVECVPRYLRRVLGLSPAAIVVVVGAVARDVVRSTVPETGGGAAYVGPVDWAGRARYVLFLPHPNARRVPKGVAAYLGQGSEEVLTAMRVALARQTNLVSP